MKKLLFSCDGKEYYANGHTNHRMKVRKIMCSDIEAVVLKPDKIEEKGYGTLFEGCVIQGLLRVYCREKPTGYVETLHIGGEMELTKAEHKNNYTWLGLTLGKLLAIQAALEEAEKAGTLTIVGNDVKIFLDRQVLGQQEPFD